MAKRITKLSDSPCYRCGLDKECAARIKAQPYLLEIWMAHLGNAEFDFHECSLWNCLMIEKGNNNGN